MPHKRDYGASDPRPRIDVHTDHNADEIRCFYEIPDSLALRIQPEDEKRTFTQCLADLLENNKETI